MLLLIQSTLDCTFSYGSFKLQDGILVVMANPPPCLVIIRRALMYLLHYSEKK